MKRLFTLLFVLWSVPSLAADCRLDRDDLLSRPAAQAGPTEVYLQSYINDIIVIRDADQSFQADLFMRIEWDDPRLAHGDAAPCSTTFDAIWWPELQPMNRRNLQQVRDMRPLVASDGRVSLLLRGFGDFSFRANLSDFPFDSQSLGFDLLSVYSDADIDFVFNPERIVLSDDLSVANFDVSMAGVRVWSEMIKSTGREHARFSIELEATRLTGFYTWQQLVPLFLVVLMAWIVFWIPREHVPSRIGLAATSMLTLIAYRFAMSSVLPPIAYLTRLDVFMIGASVLVFSALATAVAVTYTMDLVDEALAERINLTARVAAPLLLLLVTWLAFFG